MGISTIGDAAAAAMYCNTRMEAFGPVHRNVSWGAERELRAFIDELDGDPRRMDGVELRAKHYDFRRGLRNGDIDL